MAERTNISLLISAFPNSETYLFANFTASKLCQSNTLLSSRDSDRYSGS